MGSGLTKEMVDGATPFEREMFRQMLLIQAQMAMVANFCQLTWAKTYGFGAETGVAVGNITRHHACARILRDCFPEEAARHQKEADAPLPGLERDLAPSPEALRLVQQVLQQLKRQPDDGSDSN